MLTTLSWWVTCPFPPLFAINQTDMLIPNLNDKTPYESWSTNHGHLISSIRRISDLVCYQDSNKDDNSFTYGYYKNFFNQWNVIYSNFAVKRVLGWCEKSERNATWTWIWAFLMNDGIKPVPIHKNNFQSTVALINRTINFLTSRTTGNALPQNLFHLFDCS